MGSGPLAVSTLFITLLIWPTRRRIIADRMSILRDPHRGYAGRSVGHIATQGQERPAMTDLLY